MKETIKVLLFAFTITLFSCFQEKKSSMQTNTNMLKKSN